MWLIFFISLAFGKDMVTWADPHQPPFFYIRNQDAKSSLDGMQSGVTSYLSNYQHTVVEMSFASVEKNMREGRNLCSVSMLKTDLREKISYMSAFFPIPPHHIIIRKADRKIFLKKGEDRVFIARLMDQTKLTGGYTPGRSYGKNIDELLVKHKRSLAVKFYPATEIGNDLMQLLVDKKIDYTIEYKTPADVEIRRRKLSDKLDILPVVESRDLLPVYVACTRNEWGHEVILALDKAIQKYVVKEAYKDNLQGIISKESYQDFESEIKEFIQKRARGS
ncbi:hypothetical protein D3C87_257590 [compost metagenome]